MFNFNYLTSHLDRLDHDLYDSLDKCLDVPHNILWSSTGTRPKNITERGIDFADVLVGFADPMKKVAKDNRKEYGEERFNMLAKVEGRVFHMTFTERGKMTWIISARKANKREQRRYEKN